MSNKKNYSQQFTSENKIIYNTIHTTFLVQNFSNYFFFLKLEQLKTKKLPNKNFFLLICKKKKFNYLRLSQNSIRNGFFDQNKKKIFRVWTKTMWGFMIYDMGQSYKTDIVFYSQIPIVKERALLPVFSNVPQSYAYSSTNEKIFSKKEFEKQFQQVKNFKRIIKENKFLVSLSPDYAKPVRKIGIVTTIKQNKSKIKAPGLIEFKKEEKVGPTIKNCRNRLLEYFSFFKNLQNRVLENEKYFKGRVQI